jgi:signal transduction histidine kinase
MTQATARVRRLCAVVSVTAALAPFVLRTGLHRAETARRRRAERALRDTRRRTDDLLAELSHELRTPLSAILGWARLLRSTQSDPETVDRALESIERNVRAQTRILDDLLDMSHILSGRLRLEVRPTELTPLLASAIEAIRDEAQGKAIRLDTAFDPRAGVVAGDPERLQQIVWSLVSNAVRSTPAGGGVEIRLEHRGQVTEVCVTDSGPGVPPELLPHLFEVYRPADSGPARHRGGLGLGLLIARHLTDLQGGTIRAESVGVGRGTTFTVSFPSTVAP